MLIKQFALIFQRRLFFWELERSAIAATKTLWDFYEILCLMVRTFSHSRIPKAVASKYSFVCPGRTSSKRKITLKIFLCVLNRSDWIFLIQFFNVLKSEGLVEHPSSYYGCQYFPGLLQWYNKWNENSIDDEEANSNRSWSQESGTKLQKRDRTLFFCNVHIKFGLSGSSMALQGFRKCFSCLSLPLLDRILQMQYSGKKSPPLGMCFWPIRGIPI